MCIHGFLVENTNLYRFQRHLTSLAWQLTQRRLPFLLFSAEGILGHWKWEQQTMWWVDSEWFWLIGELLAQKISRAPFLLQMFLAAVSNWSYLTMKHGGLGITSLFHSYPWSKTKTKPKKKKKKKKISHFGLKVWQGYRCEQELRTGCTETLVSKIVYD